ncbi:uncharacterized protein TNCV_327871 [Trichonephila clavipes]|nr:uncharacterized protein TNCV_327871 [Trichonephila clavipes]
MADDKSLQRHFCRVSAADKGCQVYSINPRPDAVVLYSGCTTGRRRVWFLPDNRHTPSHVGLRGGCPKINSPLLSQTNAQAAESLTVSDSTQTDENITKIKCPPLKLLQPTSFLSKQNISTSIPTASTSSSSTQAHLLPSTSTISESQPSIPTFKANVPSYLADQAIVEKSECSN